MNAWLNALSSGEKVFLAAVVAFLTGFLLSWVLQHARAQTRAAISSGELARVQERLAYVEREAAELKTQILPAAEEKLRMREARELDLMREVAELQAREAEVTTRLEEERRQTELRMAELDRAREGFTSVFKALSADALRESNESFLALARSSFEKLHQSAQGDLEKRQTAIQQLVKPVGESLDKFVTHLHEVEKSRGTAYVELRQQVRHLLESETRLQAETANLVRALGKPQVRGRWGELQLRRVVELAGMLQYCDFVEQATVDGGDGRQRPDLVVRLPAGKTIVVDAKTPLAAYLEAVEAEDEGVRAQKLADHARHVSTHALELGRKAYWEQFENTPEFVVLFLPGENFFSAAVQADPELIERAVTGRVILATPTTLISLLRAVAFGWRQEVMSENAREACNLGAELYRRIATLTEHFTALGGQLGKAVEQYNKAIATLDTRVVVTARRLGELNMVEADKPPQAPAPIDTLPRPLLSDEFHPPAG